MINDPFLISILILAMLGGTVGFVGGVFGIVAYSGWMKKRFFIEYIDRKLSTKER